LDALIIEEHRTQNKEQKYLKKKPGWRLGKCVIFSVPATGHVNPSLALVEELVKLGEKVIYYNSSKFKDVITSTGAEFRDCSTDLDALVDSSGMQFGKNMIGVAYVVLKSGIEIAGKVMDDIREEKPDYIIRDIISSHGKIISKALKIPLITFSPVFAFEDKKLPPKAPLFFILKTFGMVITGFLNLLACFALAGRAAKRYGFKRKELLYAYNDFSGLNIISTTREFQYYPELFPESRFKFCGPMFYQGREKADFDFKTLPSDKIIYISLGTVYNKDIDFYRNCFKAFSGTDYSVIMSDPACIAPLKEKPENFVIRQYVPQLQVLQRAKLFITHSGMNSMHESLYYGVPVISVPQAADQFLIGKRAAALGAGIYMEKPTADRLRKAADKIFGDPKYAAAAAKLGKGFREAGGAKAAAEDVIQYMRKMDQGLERVESRE
jgi:MGT family glycosyltransferase